MASLVRQRLPACSSDWPSIKPIWFPPILLAIEDGYVECDPHMEIGTTVVPLQDVAKEPVGALYLEAFRPYDAKGDHLCDPTHAVRAMLCICRNMGRIGIAHERALKRLVRKATMGRYFRFSWSFPLLEYMLEIVGDAETAAADLDYTSEETTDDDEEEPQEENTRSNITIPEKARGQG